MYAKGQSQARYTKSSVWVLTSAAITSCPCTPSSPITIMPISEAVEDEVIEHVCLPRVALGLS